MSVTLQSIRDVLDELEISHSHDKKNKRIEFSLTNDEPCKIAIKYVFTVDEEKNLILAKGSLCEYDLDDANEFDAAYHFCNQWNIGTIMPKIEVLKEQKMILCEWVWDADSELSDDLVKKLIIVRFCSIVNDCVKKAIEAKLYPELNRILPLKNKDK